MIRILKGIISQFPEPFQQELKRYYYLIQILIGKFETDEPEYRILNNYVKPGDWVIDIGANIGHYSAKLSRLVGPNGRVIAFEPIPETFELLASNAVHFTLKNVTLINSAVSDCSSCVGMDLPEFDTGLKNYYEAHISDQMGKVNVLCFTIDTLCLAAPIKLIKIDAEGHEFKVLVGAQNILRKYHPTLIVEGRDSSVENLLNGLGYSFKELPRSPNRIFEYFEPISG